MAPVLSLLLAIAAMMAGTSPVRQAVAQTVRSDGTIAVPIGDVQMDNAIKEARARLPEFLALAHNPAPSMHTFAVKLGIPTGDGNEYIWITPFEMTDGHFIGRINNKPRNIKGIKEGQRLKFTAEDIVDWTYHHNGKRKGNLTGRAIAKMLPPAEGEALLREMNFDPEP